MNQFFQPQGPFKPTIIMPNAPRVISGAMFGGGSGEGGEEEPNSLRSHQTARVIDLLSEGPIVGPWNGIKSIYYDGVPIKEQNDSNNFENYSIIGNNGYPNQPYLKGFPVIETSIVVNHQLKKDFPKVQRITTPYIDRCRIVVSTPSLMKTDNQGNIKGHKIEYKVRIQAASGGYKEVTVDKIDGKTNTRYQRQLTFNLDGNAPWDIELSRLTDDSEDLNLQNDLFWDSYTEVTDEKVNYTLSAVIGHTVRAEDFSSVPARVIDCGGLLIKYPSNYNPTTRVYTGVWDGTFLTGWCNNPVWVFYDIIVEGRYGIGDFVSAADVDKFELYKIAQWCDVQVPDGTPGGREPRWRFNGVIKDQQEAYDLLANVASVWRGSAFWAGGTLVPTCDMPSDPVFIFSNANVIDGTFNYQNSDRRARHNQVAVAWNDPANLGERRLAIVENQQAIASQGVLKTDVVAMGCTSESQAQRVGEWLIYTEVYESDTVTFTAGLEGAYVRPGNVIKISDANIAGERRSGRLVAVTATTVTLDAPVTLLAGQTYFLNYTRPDGTVVSMGVGNPGNTTTSVLSLGGSLGAADTWPQVDSIWALASSDLEPTLWRVVRAGPNGADRYDITGMAHNPLKWDHIDRNKPLTQPDISNIGEILPVGNLLAIDFMYQLSPISIGNKMLVSWEGSAPYYDLAYREMDGPWVRLDGIAQTSVEIEVQEQTYEIWVTPRNGFGRRGPTTKIEHSVIGRTTAPNTPENFRIQVIQGVALFQWKVSDEIDVLIGGAYEMRYSPKLTDVTWASSSPIITSIPGAATTVEVPYRPGTYLLRSKDISGLVSEAPAIVVAGVPAQGVKRFIKIVEQPLFAGTHDRTERLMPQEWLILADPNAEGYYTFLNKIDMGGVFTVTLAVDLFAFPYIEGTTFVDERPGLVDDWQDWDDAGTDGNGMVTIRVSQTDNDPASGGAIWSDWKQFIAGEYRGRGFRFQAWLAAPDGQNIGIEELGIIADVSNKQDSKSDVAWAQPSMNIVYSIGFQEIPSISINIQNAATGDYYKITNKTQTGFTLQLYNASNAIITAARTFDWIAAGW